MVCANPNYAPVQVTAGESFRTTIAVRNIGNTVWWPWQYALVTESPQDNRFWSIPRQLLSYPVPPGGLARFTVTGVAPANRTGVYAFNFRMLRLLRGPIGGPFCVNRIRIVAAPTPLPSCDDTFDMNVGEASDPVPDLHYDPLSGHEFPAGYLEGLQSGSITPGVEEYLLLYTQDPKYNYQTSCPYLGGEFSDFWDSDAVTAFVLPTAAQQALQQAKTYITNRQYREAINILLKHLSTIDGDKQYLKVLGEALTKFLKTYPKTDRDWDKFSGYWDILFPNCEKPSPGGYTQPPPPANGTPTKTPTPSPTPTQKPGGANACQNPDDTQTRNFCIALGARNSAPAVRVGKVLECVRTSQYSRLFGISNPSDIPVRCPVLFPFTDGRRNGATTLYFGRNPLESKMELAKSDKGVIFEVVQHEATHLVTGYQLNRPIWRWADEGLAILAEYRGFERAVDQLRKRRADGRNKLTMAEYLWALDYVPDIEGLYATAPVVTNYFITELGGRQKFLNFLKESLSGGGSGSSRDSLERALKSVYGIEGGAAEFTRKFADYYLSWIDRPGYPKHDSDVGCLESTTPAVCPPTPPTPTPKPPVRTSAAVTVNIIKANFFCKPCNDAVAECDELKRAYPGKITCSAGYAPSSGGYPLVTVRDSAGRAIPPFDGITTGYTSGTFRRILTPYLSN